MNETNKPAAVDRLTSLKRGLLLLALFNFFLVTLSGWLLRGMMWLAVFPLPFRNMVHAHSHFAFGGWVTPGLLWMIMTAFPELAERVAYRHWRNVTALLITSAYGMLLTFPLQGYGAASIAFSTISIVATFYLSIMLLRAMNGDNHIAYLFLKAALLFLMLSAAGPLSLGPVSAVGKAGSALYWNCIYFYLHFQYNGWFTFAVLAAFYKRLTRNTPQLRGQAAFAFLFAGCILSLLLSFLWNKPGIVYSFAGGLGAVLQLAGAGFLVRNIIASNTRLHPLEKIALSAFFLKLVLQAMSAFPFIAALAYTHRNFIIAYLHLIMLGWVSIYMLNTIITTWSLLARRRLLSAFVVYFFGFLVTEVLLVAEAFTQTVSFPLMSFPLWMFIISTALPLAALLIWRRARHEEDHSQG